MNQFSGVTHCIRGHAFDEENTEYRTDGRGRECRQCRRDRCRRWRERNARSGY